MTGVLLRTIRVVETDRLLLLEREAARLGFSQRLPADWLWEHAQAAVHYLFPAMEHWLALFTSCVGSCTRVWEAPVSTVG